MADDEINVELPERYVENQAISKSFKGILRVSNIKELETQYINDEKITIPDNFLVDEYYGNYKPTLDADGNIVTWTPEGIQNTLPALEGIDNPRYVTTSDFTNLKIPVTDSLGNWMNFSLGADSSSIGMNQNAAELTFTNDGVVFPIVLSETLKVGLSARVLEYDKIVENGKLKVVSDGTISPKIVIDSYYRHGENDTNNKLTEVSYSTRSIFEGKVSSKPYDAFIYRQEYYNTNVPKEDISSTPTTNLKKDCYIKLENLNDYIDNKIQRYINYNTTQLPPGTIVWQYCSLNKWYCKVEGTINTVDDDLYWQGYRPAMGKSAENAQYGNLNTLQGVYYGNSYITYIPEKESYSVENIELAPEFKRDYVLCDGSSYTISLVPSYISQNTKEKNSLQKFLPLFFTIGYYYNGDEDILSFPHIWNANTNRYTYDYSKTTDNYYRWTKIAYKNISKETLYGIHMAVIAAFMKFEEAYKDANIFNTITDSENRWDIEKSIQWLKNQPIDYRYIFNTIFSEESIAEAIVNGDDNEVKNIIYSEVPHDGDPQRIDITVGREVNKFSDFIEYYESMGENIARKTYCPIYKMAEIYDMARLYRARADFRYDNNSALPDWLSYQFTFKVPAFYTEKDKLFNQANVNSATTTSSSNTSVGLFLGSNGLLAAKNIFKAGKGLVDKDGEYIENIDDYFTYSSSSCTFVLGATPHSHAIMKGVKQLIRGKHSMESNIDSSNETYFNTLSTTGAANKVILNNDELNRNIVSANFTWDTDDIGYVGGSSLRSTKYKNKQSLWNYFIQEVGAAQGATLTMKTNTMSGTFGKELTNGDYLWYSRTSTAIWDNDKIETGDSKYTEGGSNQGYFRPESIKMLPLIKL